MLKPINDIGETALIIAQENGRVEVVQALIKRGTDVLAQDNQGLTVFDFANGRHEIIAFNSVPVCSIDVYPE